jgi:hypothetical protein
MRPALFLLTVGAVIAASPLSAEEPPVPVLAVFPFSSPDEAGSAGARFADNLRLRAKRLGLVIVDPLSLAEAMAGAEAPGLETPFPRAAALVRERLDADLALWGEVRPLG